MKRIVVRLGIYLLAGFGLMSCGKSSESAAEDYGLYCKEHGVPEKFCTLCHAELKDKLLLCAEHGNIPEDICTLCHKGVKEKYDIEVCPKHDLPKHFCIECEKEGTAPAEGKEGASGNLIDDGWRAAFGEKSADGKLAYCEKLPLVRLASPTLTKEVGLETAAVSEEERIPELTTQAEVTYDNKRIATITSITSGFLKEAKVDVGSKVKNGDVLAVVDSSQISAAKTEYLSAKESFRLAESNSQRIEKLVASASIPTKEGPAALAALNQARATLRAAEQRLHGFQFEKSGLDEISRTNDTTPLRAIVAPMAGTVVERKAVSEVAVEAGSELFTVIDTSKLLLTLNVYERDIEQVQQGQEVFFTVSGSHTDEPETVYPGRITWVGVEVDEKTRTAKVRAEVDNPDGNLRAHQVGQARIKLGESYHALSVPKAAIQRFENVDLVFLAQEAGAYRPQRVKTKPMKGTDFVEVTWGLKPKQEIVVAGAFLLKTEIMKGSIGAGCCE